MTVPPVAWLSAWPTAPCRAARAGVWAGPLDSIPQGADALAPTARDREEAERRPPAARAAFLRRRAALRRLVAIQSGTPLDDVMVGNDPGGRPLVLAPAGPWHVSAGFRDGWLALAFASDVVGVDIEPADGSEAPAWNMLSRPERERLAATPPDRRWHDFIVLWTAKEAYLKALGTGLLREPSAVTVDHDAGDNLRVRDDDGAPAGQGATRVFLAARAPMRVSVVTLPTAAT